MTTDYLHLAVGEKFDHGMPAESMSIMLNSGIPMLTFNFSVSEKNIAAFLHGSTSFGLFTDNNILFFLFKIDGFLDWSDLAFTIHLAGDEKLTDEESYLPFHLLLIESETSIIKGMRIVTVSPDFRSLLSEIIQQQHKEKFDTVAYYKNIGAIYDVYPDVTSMLRKGIITEQGGLTLPD